MVVTYIDDLCRGILKCGELDEAVGEIFILGGENHVTLNEFVEQIANVVGGRIPHLRIPLGPVSLAAVVVETVCRPLGIEPPLHRRRLEFFSKHRAADISKARRILGYTPEVPLPDGLARTAKWYRDQGLL